MEWMGGEQAERRMAWILGLLLFAGALLVRSSPVWGLLAASIGSSALLFVLWNRLRPHLPFRVADRSRAVLMILFLTALILAWQLSLPMSVAGPDPLLLGAFRERILLMTLALFFVPATIFTELYLRGFLYSLFEARGGWRLAVGGTTLVSFVLFSPLLGFDPLSLVAALGVFLTLAISRRVTGSVAPAAIAQGLVGLVSSVFLFALGIASGPSAAPLVGELPVAVQIETIEAEPPEAWKPRGGSGPRLREG
jgi:hypothetical protein